MKYIAKDDGGGAMELHMTYSNIRDLLEGTAAECPDSVYVAFKDREIPFGRFNDDVNRFANGLLALGIGRGDMVHIYMDNCPEMLVATLACHKIGAIAGPVNTWLKAGEIKYQFNDSKAKGLVIQDGYLPVLDQIRSETPHIEHVVQLGGPVKEGHTAFGELLSGGSPELKPVPLEGDDLAFIFYTAGTTGHPKGALLTHGNVVFEVASLREALEGIEEPGEEPVALIFLPLFHVNAMMSMIVGISRGNKTALLEKFSVREFGPTVEKHRCSFFSAVPKVYKILIQAKDTVCKYDLSSLKFGICGAAPMPPESIRQFEELFGVEILEGYGLTEGTVASTLHRRGGKKKIGSIGPALPGHEVTIFDENDDELPPGKVGEIVFRGPNLMKGYLGLEEENRAAFRGGWFHTGDMGYRDEEGFFYIVDRAKDMIIKGGENIYPKEIEDVISTHPSVHDVAVIGILDEISGEEVKAFVVPRLGATLVTEEEIIDQCKEQLADFKVPREVEFVAGIPASALGKALKRRLREGKGIIPISRGEDQPPLTLDIVFQMMPYRFNAEKAGTWKATLRYELFGPSGGTWTLCIADGKLEVVNGPTENPTCIVRMMDQVFAKLVAREIDGVFAINSGLIQLDGNESDMAMLAEVMG
jgi:long-chain acyl-CoA synthetase